MSNISSSVHQMRGSSTGDEMRAARGAEEVEARSCSSVSTLDNLLAFSLFIDSLVNVLEILNGHWHVDVIKDVQGLLRLRVHGLSFSLDNWLINWNGAVRNRILRKGCNRCGLRCCPRWLERDHRLRWERRKFLLVSH